MIEPSFTLRDLAHQTDTKVETIVWYQQNGIIPITLPSSEGHRLYKQVHVDRLSFIRHLRSLGFGLEDIRDLLKSTEVTSRTHAETVSNARRHLALIRSKLSRLHAMEAELSRVIDQGTRSRSTEWRMIKVVNDLSRA